MALLTPTTGSTGLTIAPVRSRTDRAEFLELPYRLYGEHTRHRAAEHPGADRAAEPLVPAPGGAERGVAGGAARGPAGADTWVPPLRGEQRRLLDRRANPFFEHGEVELFLVRRDGRPIGRIAAVDDPRHNSHHGGSDGFFGLFECAEDAGAARVLSEAAAAWLRGRGLERMLGPVSFTTHDACGLLVDGYERPPAVLMPHNPAYYPGLLDAAGHTAAKDLLAWEFPTTLHEDQRLRNAAARVERDGTLRVRPLDMSRYGEETALLRRLYNTALDGTWGFTPIGEREFALRARKLRRVVRPELVVIAEVAGEPAGFALAVPDIAPALAAADGRLVHGGLPTGLLRYLRAQRHVDRARLAALGVLPEHRGRGLELLMYQELSRAAQRAGIRTGEASWVLEDNRQGNAVLRRIGAQVIRRYRVYERPV
ncbi:GNAT family N-acetyltransferase [Streptomyces sp. ODS28]|uniref:GNAT family N-acetyltransferase n=1 Tax=Streptomyces sp. ODS28 TaxID=3136688 RepID=UPI0031E636EE